MERRGKGGTRVVDGRGCQKGPPPAQGAEVSFPVSWLEGALHSGPQSSRLQPLPVRSLLVHGIERLGTAILGPHTVIIQPCLRPLLLLQADYRGAAILPPPSWCLGLVPPHLTKVCFCISIYSIQSLF